MRLWRHGYSAGSVSVEGKVPAAQSSCVFTLNASPNWLHPSSWANAMNIESYAMFLHENQTIPLAAVMPAEMQLHAVTQCFFCCGDTWTHPAGGASSQRLQIQKLGPSSSPAVGSQGYDSHAWHRFEFYYYSTALPLITIDGYEDP